MYLQLLLRNMFSGKNIDTKLASIGQSIIHAIRPRTKAAPLQLGLGIQMHHHFASRFLVDTLHEHGFACSHVDVMKYDVMMEWKGRSESINPKDWGTTRITGYCLL